MLPQLPEGVVRERGVGPIGHPLRVKSAPLGRGAAHVQRDAREFLADAIRGKDLPAQLAAERACQGAFSCSDAPHDDQRLRLRTAHRVLQREPEIPAGAGAARSALGLGDPGGHLLEALHFSAHIGAVALVEVEQREQPRILESAGEALREMAREFRVAGEVEIHRQERGVAGHVNVAEAVVEFDAVVNREAFPTEMNVLEVQVAVAIADAPFVDARGEKGRVPAVKRHGPVADCGKRRTRDGHADEVFGLPEVFVGADPQVRDAAPLFDLRGRLLRLVKWHQRLDDLVHLTRRNSPLGEQPRQKAALRQAAHLDRVFDDFAVASKTQAAPVHRDGHDSEMSSGTEPPVQLHLALAEVTPLFQGREIEEPEVHGFLHLVSPPPDERQPSGVGLEHPDALRRAGV